MYSVNLVSIFTEHVIIYLGDTESEFDYTHCCLKVVMLCGINEFNLFLLKDKIL